MRNTGKWLVIALIAIFGVAVTACDDNGDSKSGGNTAPGVPQNFHATPGNEQVILSWTAPESDGGSAITGYRVSRDNGGTWVSASSSTGHTFTGLINETSYTFKVRAVNAIGNGAEATAVATPSADAPLPTWGISLSQTEDLVFSSLQVGYSAITPITITVNNTGNQPTGALTVGLTGINASSFGLTGETIENIAASGNTTFTVGPNHGLAPNTYNAIVTVSSANENIINMSFDVSFTVTLEPPAPTWGIELDQTTDHDFGSVQQGYTTVTPLPVTVINTGNQPTGVLTVALTGINALSFGLTGETIENIAASGNTVFDVVPNQGLTANTYNATVTVSSTNAEITSRSFNVSFTVTAPPTVPASPMNFIAVGGDTEAILTWEAPTSDGGSAIIRYEVSSNDGGTWVTASSNTGHTFTGLTNGTMYSFRVRAVNAVGNGTQAIASATPAPPTPRITIHTQPAATTTVTALNISGSLSVNASVTMGGEISYQWYTNTSASNVGGQFILEASNASLSIPNLTAGTYYFFVEVSADGAASVRSNPATVIVQSVVQGSFVETVPVPGGSFSMTGLGTVTLTSFNMGKYQITQEQFQKVMWGHNPSHFTTAKGRPPVVGETDAKRPVETVSWYEAIIFCNRLSMMEGLTPAYRINGSTNPNDWIGVTYHASPANLPPEWFTDSNVAYFMQWGLDTVRNYIIYHARDMWDAVEIVPGSTGYRLPTDAQWEYAARGGAPVENFNFSGSNTINNVAWHSGNSGDMTHEVGLRAPNRLDLYDMSGNVWEWCWNWLGTYSVALPDPQGPSNPADYQYQRARVVRGGGWNYNSNVTERSSLYPEDTASFWSNRGDLGFRVVRPSLENVPIITVSTQPVRTTIVRAGNISGSLSVTASVTQGQTLSYQWFSNTTDSTTGGTLISGATGSSFAIPTNLAAGRYYYYCVVSATGNTTPITTRVAIVTVFNRISFIEMLPVTGGTFELGRELGVSGALGDTNPVSTVTLMGFNIGKFPVTQDQYFAVMGINPSQFTSSPDGNADNLPVERVSWFDAIIFSNRLSMMEGLTPAYRIDGETDPDIWITKHGLPTFLAASSPWHLVEIVPSSTGYRLPTEAQWEFAAKGGSTPGSFAYSGSDSPEAVAWYIANSGNRTHEVGRLAANGLGIFDMSGNVFEWCFDWRALYTNTPKNNPTGPSTGDHRVARGGSWTDLSAFTRNISRGEGYPDLADQFTGFRLVRPNQ
jgi:formylglycine-generating enzyme required for sulfatase activity